jgi:hypothetical protein
LRLAEAKRRQTERDSREHPAASVPNDALSNPYYPPFKANCRVLVGRSYKHPDAPANADYTQIGILTKSATGDGENIIPLFGKRSDVSRSKYQYYDEQHRRRQHQTPGLQEQQDLYQRAGCDEIYSGDSVFVDTASTFNAKVYETNLLRYIPECELSIMAV